jgi:glutamate-1-semialdehyde aminotransferase
MPHVIIRFRLPDEQADYNTAMQGALAKSALWEIDQACRSLLKYGEPTEAEAAIAERIRALIPSELIEG